MEMSEDQPLAGSPAGDDEFAKIEPPARPRSAIMALVVVGLGGVLSWHLRADLAYAFGGRAPADLGDARTLAAHGGDLADNRYVTLSGQPERRHALYIEPRGEKIRQSFFRLLGTGTRILV